MNRLPEFNERGELPEGIHAATLAAVLARFGKTARRVVIGRRLERVHALASSTGHLSRFIIFGSFVTDKAEPNDVDIFLLMEDSFDVRQVSAEARLVFDHSIAQNRLGASVFWIRRMAALDDENTALAHWQIKRDGSKRGIVEVTL